MGRNRIGKYGYLQQGKGGTMSDPKCANCGYECPEVSSETGFCDNCQNAYEKGVRIGYRTAKQEGEGDE